MILHYFKKKENIEKKIADDTYKKILLESNFILKENNCFSEKNYKSSFEVVSILLIIYINLNIKNKIVNYKDINENLIMLFISDLDESLRTKGIGDMSIGKYVKSYVKKFYFRLSKFPENINNDNYNDFELYFSNFDFIKDEEISNASRIFWNIYKKIHNSY